MMHGHTILKLSVSWFRQLVANISPHRLRFELRLVHVGFVVDKAGGTQTGSVPTLRLSPVRLTLPSL